MTHSVTKGIYYRYAILLYGCFIAACLQSQSLPTPQVQFSVRKVNAAYQGKALRIRSTLNNLESDIGFDASGDLDTFQLRQVLSLSNRVADSTTGATAVYSLRLLRADYKGPALRVRKFSNGQSTDIGFDTHGFLDTTALKTFAGTDTTVLATIWYDQSGNQLHALQTTNARQPYIIRNGKLVYSAGNLTLEFRGTQVLEVASNPIFDANNYTLFVSAFCYGDHPALDFRTQLAGRCGAGSGSYGVSLRRNGTNSSLIGLVANSSSFQVLNPNNTPRQFVNIPIQATNYYVSNTVARVEVNQSFSNAIATYTHNTANGQAFSIGNRNNLNPQNVHQGLYEVILYTQGLTPTRRQQIANNQMLAYRVTDALTLPSLPAQLGAKVVRWYDQSGNANHATQSDTARQPIIVEKGQIIKRNTVLLKFPASGAFLQTSNFLQTGTRHSVYWAGDQDTTGNLLIAGSPSAGAAWGWRNRQLVYTLIGNSTGISYLQQSRVKQMSWVRSNSNVVFYQSGAVLGQATLSANANAFASGVGGTSAQPFRGLYGEIQVFALATDPQAHQLIQTSQISYFEKDTLPPSPLVAEWKTPPTGGANTVLMRAKTAQDTSGVEYFFECVSGGGHHSGWQMSSVYVDSGLLAQATYTYRVRTRDRSSNRNLGQWSASRSATTLAPGASQTGGFTYNWVLYDQTDDNILGLGPVILPLDDTTGLRAIRHAPPPFSHPRIWFDSTDIPDIKYRLQHTNSGKNLSKYIHAFTTVLNLGSAYNSSASYAKDPDGLPYIVNHSVWNWRPSYLKLLSRDTSFRTTYRQQSNAIYRLAITMSAQAMECLLYRGTVNVEAGNIPYDTLARQLAKGMTFWAELILQDPDISGGSTDLFGGVSMALCYDLNYWAMTDIQRSTVRQALAKIITDVPRYGADIASFVTTSNWATLNSIEILPNLAIEFEPGYKPQLTIASARLLRNFYSHGWYSTGAPFEDLGKGNHWTPLIIAMAKRGYSLLGLSSVRNFGRDYLPGISQPFGYSLVGTDLYGGTGSAGTPESPYGGFKCNPADAIGLKWIMPNDKSVDYIWRSFIEKGLANSTRSTGYFFRQLIDRSHNFYFNILIPAIAFVQDYNPEPIDNQLPDILQHRSEYIDSIGGTVTMRSDFTTNALFCHFHCRQDLGGHTSGDRNSFSLSGLGRIWIPKISSGDSETLESSFHNTVLINGLGIPRTQLDGTKCRQPAKLVRWKTTPDFASIGGDATYAYSWEWHWQPNAADKDHNQLGTNGWTKVTETRNDFQLWPRPESYYRIPFYEQPAWNNPGKFERIIKRPYNPMKQVIRHVAMVKGLHPYLLIADDINKNDQPQDYQWRTMIANDLILDSTVVDLNPNAYRCDLIFKEPSSEGNRRLLVRILNKNGFVIGDDLAQIERDTLSNQASQWLTLNSRSINPEFKVMLYPFITGTALPRTHWLHRDSIMRVVHADGQQDEIRFLKSANIGTPIEYAKLAAGTTLQLKLFLQGALLGSNQVGLMHDSLRVGAHIPLNDPYTFSKNNRFAHAGQGAQAITTSSVLSAAAGTPNAIVDWVFIELRAKSNPSLVIETRAALIQRDGDVVQPADGQSPLTFTGLTDSDYYVAVKHRNHLGVMTANPVSFTPDTVRLNFAEMPASALFNHSGYDGLELATVGSVKALWAGNARPDSKVKYQGPSNDGLTILNQVLSSPDNSRNLYNYSLVKGYFDSDVNLDGKIRYQGLQNDVSLILFNVTTAFAAMNKDKLYNYDLMTEQIPR